MNVVWALTEVTSLDWLQINIMLSGPTSPLEGSPTTLCPPPWKYISSSMFDTPSTNPGIVFAAAVWACKPWIFRPSMREQVQLKEHVQLNCREHACRQEIVSSFFERCKARGFCIILVGYGVREVPSQEEVCYAYYYGVREGDEIPCLLNMACRTIEDPEPYSTPTIGKLLKWGPSFQLEERPLML